MQTIITLIELTVLRIGKITAYIIVPLVLATCYEVFSRYLLGAPTIWAYELGYILTGTHFLLGASLALQKKTHIRIDLIYNHFSPRKKSIVDLTFYCLLFLPFLILLSHSLWDYGYRAFLSGEQSGQSAWSPPIWPFRMALTLGFVLLTLQVIAEMLKCVNVIRNGSEQPESET
ncbi:MAG: TRAP transporter small permease subunit [Alphaproteobacteria bacterium]